MLLVSRCMAPPVLISRSITSRPKHPALLLLLLFFTPGLWIVFVATTSQHELMVGLFTSAATIIFTMFVCRSSSTDLCLRPRDVLQCRQIPWRVACGLWEIVLVLFKDLLGIAPPQSMFRVCGFDGGTHDPVRVARTVLAVAYTTTAPNFIVVGIEPALSRMLFHQITPTEISRMTEALGAKA